MNIWGSKTLRRLALPLAVVSVGAALTAGWGQSLASKAPATAADVNASDPEVAVQSVAFVQVPRDNDNFRPENACGGSPAVTIPPVGPPVEKANAFNTGIALLRNLSIGPSRCTLAVFKPTIHQGKDLLYSSRPCPVTTAPATAPNVSLKFAGLHTPGKLQDCTAGVFLSTLDGPSKTTPDVRNNSLTAAQSAAGRVAIHDWAGSSCKPGPCTLFATLVQQEGDFNSPGLCSAAFYVTGPCTVAVVTTSGVNGPVFTPTTCPGPTNTGCTAGTPATPLVITTPNSGIPATAIASTGGKTLNFSDSNCPASTSLSNRGDVQEGCTNLPFKPADMSFTLPPAATPPNEVLFPCLFPFVPGDGCGKAKHSVEIAQQSITLVLNAQGQDEHDPPNACAIPGDTLSSLVVTRCTASLIAIPVGFTGGDLSIPTSRCTLDLSNSTGHGNNQGNACFAQPFSPSKGNTIIHNMPPVVCRAPIPAIPVGTPALTPLVPCQIEVVLTHDDGDFNAEQPCGNVIPTLPIPATFAGNAGTCLFASFNTEGHQQSDTLTGTSTTPVCPAGNGTKPVIDADVTGTCVSADGSAAAGPFTAGSLKAFLVGPVGGPTQTFSVTIPEDRIV